MARTWIYSAVDHCTGRRWVSQTKARSREHLGCLLREIYGNGLELLSAEIL
jgi:hypothetical protein